MMIHDSFGSFRPLSGIMLLHQMTENKMEQVAAMFGFPSPVGDYVSSLDYLEESYQPGAWE